MVNMKELDRQIISAYENLVRNKYPDKVVFWPVLAGHNSKIGKLQDWWILILEHTGSPSWRGEGIHLSASLIGFENLNISNKDRVRTKLEKYYNLKPTDGIVMVDSQGEVEEDLSTMLRKHEYAMGLVSMKIFLSHKGVDKTLVREYKKTLEELGFEPWLDEDAMSAGTELERGILQGIQDSCAVVFFVTPNFKDENFLASEVNYAIAEKRKKQDGFAIITLVLNRDGNKGEVPELLKTYVWKEPQNDLEGLREILRALPVRVGEVYWKNP